MSSKLCLIGNLEQGEEIIVRSPMRLSTNIHPYHQNDVPRYVPRIAIIEVPGTGVSLGSLVDHPYKCPY